MMDAFWLDFKGLREHQCLLQILLSKSDVNSTKGSKVANMTPKWVPKRIQNRSKNMIDLLMNFEAVLEPATVVQPPTGKRAGAMEGIRGRHKPLVLGIWNRI